MGYRVEKSVIASSTAHRTNLFTIHSIVRNRLQRNNHSPILHSSILPLLIQTNTPQFKNIGNLFTLLLQQKEQRQQAVDRLLPHIPRIKPNQLLHTAPTRLFQLVLQRSLLLQS